jgi:hypothetical protein
MLTSVFGDGMVEIPRHAHLGTVALHVLILLGLVLLLTRLRGLVRTRADALAEVPVPRIFEWTLLAMLTTVPTLSPLWLSAWRQQPMALGVLDEPESNTIASSSVTLHGWAMDPFGAARAVAIVNNARRVSAHPWRHPSDPDGAALARAFPTYRDPAVARFEIVIDAARLGQPPISVRTYAVNRDGVITEIDRRVLTRPAP